MTSRALAWRLAAGAVLVAIAGCTGGDDKDADHDGLSRGRIEQIGRAYGEIVTTCDGKMNVAPIERRRAAQALGVLTVEHRRAPTERFRIEDSGGEETLQSLLEGVVILTFDTGCRSLAHRAKRELDRELERRSR